MTERVNGHYKSTDVIVIGAGLAGLFAAVRAVKAGARVRVIAQGWGQQIVTPGWLSVCDRADDDVIAEVRGYAALNPGHPYALAEDEAMVRGLNGFCSITEVIGLPYAKRHKDGHNMRLITMLGAVQKAMIAPRGIANADLTEIDGPVLLVGFRGWRDFFPELAAGNLQNQGIEARALWIDLPDKRPYWDMWPGDLARSFDRDDFRAEVIRQIKPHIRGITRVGFPAVLGMDHPGDVLDDLSARIERPVFEIPTLPPSVAGVRLSNRLRGWLMRQGARVQIGHPVVRGIVENKTCRGVEVEALGHTNPFYADQIILATGGLYSGGILSDESGRLWEPIFDFPVQSPPDRAGWYHDHLLKERGHPVHRLSGLRVDHQMRPLDANGAPIMNNVYAVGHMIAGFNPLTDGCAEGIALATAYKAIQTALELDNHG
jgi:glycerol-3-phosphate dehydrogenase subunit B